MTDARPASPPAPQFFPEPTPDRPKDAGGRVGRRPRADRLIATFAIAICGLAALRFGWLSIPNEWRRSVVLGAGLLLTAVAAGVPVLLRARSDLRSARRLLNVATRRMEQAYERLLATNEELVRTAEARDRALVDLRAAVREREAFLDAVAHDLKTPLTVIKGNTDLLAVTLARGRVADPATLSRNLGRIAESAEQMRLMINELLALARLEEAAPIVAMRQPIDLVDLAREAILHAAAETGRHTIVLDAATENLVGSWDRQRLERLLGNLLVNAVKYSPAGGTITVEIAAEHEDGTARISVRDEGIGIPSDELDRVFERFFRASNAPPGVPGTGLGLASVRQTAELHGGTVEVESREGAGTCVTVRLPRRPPGERQKPAAGTSAMGDDPDETQATPPAATESV